YAGTHRRAVSLGGGPDYHPGHVLPRHPAARPLLEEAEFSAVDGIGLDLDDDVRARWCWFREIALCESRLSRWIGDVAQHHPSVCSRAGEMRLALPPVPLDKWRRVLMAGTFGELSASLR